jgi:hypothetical protein
MQEQDHWPLLAVIPPPLFWQVDLVSVRCRTDLNSAIEKPGFLRRVFPCVILAP